ncbi:MAG: HU family DNA-binding protein [Caldisericia bacterium]|jgi:DNA-binding protein HU-beta|nr:HU family DNA-binding protein [Caldisericia bacterium]MCX8095503.1 HU family DNA-binding protein [Caldisericia bacterium]
MTKPEIVSAIAEKAGVTKKVAAATLEAFIETVMDALKKGEKVALVGFGTFEVRERKPRKGINPQTRKPIQIPAKKVPAFRAGKELKAIVPKK